MRKNKHTGSNFHDFLKEEGILEDVQAMATKKILIMELLEAMEKQQMAYDMYQEQKDIQKLISGTCDEFNTNEHLRGLFLLTLA